ncbi:MAG: efflux RND transporter periplasmic adaptor subunit [Patescibacteria group bacterium]|nr:efflux RND transporter periplasmic adaptor subunit [Patescibacteria group bacterium]
MFKFLKARKLFTGFLILMLIFTGYFGYKKFGPKNISDLYELTTVTRQDLKKTVVASGKIKSQSQIDLKFQTAGQLAWVNVKEGDLVKKWQAIAGLNVNELQKNLEKSLRDYSKERNDFEEDRQITYGEGVNLTNTIKRILEKNQWDLDKAVLDVELKDIALKYSTLISPLNGIITHIDISLPGVNITPATAVFTVADPEHLEFEALIDEIDIGLIQLNQSAQLILDSYPNEPLNLTVNAINFNSSLDSSGSTVFLVKFKLENNLDQKFKLGMNGEIAIDVAEKQNVIAIPLASVLEEEENTTVQIVKDNTLINQTINLGMDANDLVEVTSGLSENQIIVVSKKSK